MRPQRRINSAKKLTRVALSAAFLAVSAMICVPFAVPFTLQTFAVYLILFLFGGAAGLASVGLYVATGLVGLPVFAGFRGGAGCLFEPGGGFIAGLLLLALVYFVFESVPHLPSRQLVGVILSFFALYLSGTLGLLFVYGIGEIRQALLMAAYYILPYALPDVLKILLAFYTAKRLKKCI